MKKLITILTLLLISQVLHAQAPQATSYQAVIRNSIGNVLSNQLVKVRFSIRDSAANGTVVYQETQTPTSNTQGLINLFAGQGTAVAGTFAGINWGSKSKFLQTEVDITGGSNYTDMGTMQLMSVPYALYANNGNSDGSKKGEMMYWNGNSWIKVSPGGYGQTLVICDSIPTWGGCLPKVTNTTITAITLTSAIGGGTITSDGGSYISSKGVCWSLNANPTILLTTKTNEGTGAGVFSSTISGLSANTTYHVRAYAVNNIGVSYGPDITFNTNNSGFVNISNVPIGSQIWVDKNLYVSNYRNGDPIPQVTDAAQWRNLTTGAWCWYNNDSATYSVYGKLYNWYAVNDPRGLAPAGWKIPVLADWKKLIKFIDFNIDTLADYIPSSRIANVALKNTSYWGLSGGQDCNNGNNAVGFSAMPSGNRNVNGSFYSVGTSGLLWYADEYSYSSGRIINVSCSNPLGDSYTEKQSGFPVRVLKDTIISPIVSIPNVLTTAINSLLANTANSGGTVISSGGAAVTSRGVCWSTSSNPTILLSTKTIDSSGTGSFTSSLTGLISNTTYYLRAYATNSAGTAYGTQIVFSTPQLTLPILTSSIVSNIQFTIASGGGNITSNGGATITGRGVCWSTSPNPTIALSTKTVNGTGEGTFTSSISGLTQNTTYYLRAYATNSFGTGYGSQITFSTLANLSNVTIGSQVWTNKNLDVARYRNGDIIPQVTDPTQWTNLTTGAWCWYNNDSATNAATYGRLYNWYAVNDSRGLAPNGWHIPTDAEWNKLVKYLDPGADTTCSGCAQSAAVGGALKTTTGWFAPNTGATNSTGFSGLPGGYRFEGGLFNNIDFYGYWWSATEPFTTNAWTRFVYYSFGGVNRNSFAKSFGISVRCVKD